MSSLISDKALKIELPRLLRLGYIKKYCQISKPMLWQNGNQIMIESTYTDYEAYINLDYKEINCFGDEKKKNIRINLTTVPSNLGKGEVLYFICPLSGKRCKILYKFSGISNWGSRGAFESFLYNTQACSKRYYHNTRYNNIRRELNSLYPQVKKQHYQGIKTNLLRRISHLEKEMEKHDSYFDEYLLGKVNSERFKWDDLSSEFEIYKQI